MTHAERVSAVAALGFTERQAAFLVLVMLHSGVCVGRQYCAFAGIVRGQKMADFFQKLDRQALRDALPVRAQQGPRLPRPQRQVVRRHRSAGCAVPQALRARSHHRTRDDAGPHHRPSRHHLARRRTRQGRPFPHHDVAAAGGAAATDVRSRSRRHRPVLSRQVAHRRVVGRALPRPPLPAVRADRRRLPDLPASSCGAPSCASRLVDPVARPDRGRERGCRRVRDGLPRRAGDAAAPDRCK